jgi:hypothetical protein
MFIISISTVAVHLTAVLKWRAISTASWNPIAVIASVDGESMLTKNKEKNAKTVAIR